MYIPAYSRATDADVAELLRQGRAADLVTTTAVGLLATMLPMVYDEPGSHPGVGPLGSLLGHVARKNDQWREPAVGEAMAIIRGPDAYISPSWFASKRDHGRVVPTWNYITAHLYGDLVIHDDPAWVEANVRRLTDTHEAGRTDLWSVDDAPPPFIAGLLLAIVGVELHVNRIEAKLKLSQNRSDADIEGAIAGLEATDEQAMAASMRAALRRSEPQT